MSFFTAFKDLIFSPDKDIVAVLLAAGLATMGWMHAASAARSLSRKQHTINVMLSASMDKNLTAALDLFAFHAALFLVSHPWYVKPIIAMTCPW